MNVNQKANGETADPDRATGRYPEVGELWDCDERVAMVAGTGVESDGRLWVFDWNSGQDGDFPLSMLTFRADRRSLTETAILDRVTKWAGEGSASAMWWLAWWLEGRDHPKSVWYYIAAMRRAPEDHAWALDRVRSDAKYACMCRGVPAPDLAFLGTIPEMSGPILTDWRDAIRQAEAATHVASSVRGDSRRVFKGRRFAPGDADRNLNGKSP